MSVMQLNRFIRIYAVTEITEIKQLVHLLNNCELMQTTKITINSIADSGAEVEHWRDLYRFLDWLFPRLNVV
ncbi:MAG: hypothetical protein V7782_09815 [Psychromonas sp.]